MPGKQVECDICFKGMRSDNLTRHKKLCKGSRNHSGSGLLHSTNTTYPPTRRLDPIPGNLLKDKSIDNGMKLDYTEMEHDDEHFPNSSGSEECANDGGMDAATSVSTGSDDESESSSDSFDNSFNLWKQLIQVTIDKKRATIFDTLSGFIHVYYFLTEDDAYQEIMQDVKGAYQKMDFVDALDYAISKNKALILTSVENADDSQDCFDIWCVLSNHIVTKKCNSPYSLCFCKRCQGSSIARQLKFLMVMFQWMLLDDTIQSITKTVKQITESGDVAYGVDVVNLALEQHEKVILDKIREAEKEIFDKITAKNTSGSGMYLNPWNR